MSETLRAGSREAAQSAAAVPRSDQEQTFISLDRLVAALRLDQVKYWQKGERTPAEAYLSMHPQLQAGAEQALDLVYGEYLLREELGEQPDALEYERRFPLLADRLRKQIDLHRAVTSSVWDSSITGHDSGHRSSTPKLDILSTLLADDLPTIAGYDVLRELGRGGMGVVYLAREKRLQRLVALKVIGLVGSGSEQARRFQAEATAAAGLQHPNIVQIYRVAEHNSRPYLALEFVDGGNLSQYLAGRPVTPLQGAQVVQILARAIHHAHQRGIVHRDLKPANILLQSSGSKLPRAAPSESDADDRGAGDRDNGQPTILNLESAIPKIADFGLAKRLEDSARLSKTGDIIGTASYMAPEQARGETGAVGPAIDIYALGAILYELLTGRPPFQGANAVDTLLLVRTEEPVPPRRLQPKVPRDLETICLKCLEKEPHQRYATALDLAEDLRLTLAGEPIVNRPVSQFERLIKWARRKPAQAALWTMGILAALVLLGTWAGFTAELRAGLSRELGEKDRAEQNAQAALAAKQEATASADLAKERSRLALGALQTLVREVSTKLSDATDARTRALRQALTAAALPGLAALTQSTERAEADTGRAQAHLGIGDIYFLIDGKTLEAQRQYEQMREIAEAVLAQKPDDAGALAAFATAHERLGEVNLRLGQPTRARELYRLALDSYKKRLLTDPVDPVARRGLAIAYLKLGDLAESLRDPARRDYFQKGLAEFEKLEKSVPDDLVARRQLAVAYSKMGNVSLAERDMEGATRFYGQFLKIMEKLAADKTNPQPYQARRDLSVAYNKVGDLQLQLKEISQARLLYEQALQLRERLAEEDPRSALAKRDVTVSLEKLAQSYLDAKDPEPARSYLDRALPIRRALVERDPSNLLAQSDLLVIYDRLALAEKLLANWPAAREYCRQGLIPAECVAKADPGNAAGQRELGVAYLTYAEMCRRTRDLQLARDYAGRARGITERLAEKFPREVRTRADQADCYALLAGIEQDGAHFDSARDWLKKSAHVLEEIEKQGSRSTIDLSEQKKELGISMRVLDALPKALADPRHALSEPEEIRGQLLLARAEILFREQHFREAAETLGTVSSGQHFADEVLFETACAYALCALKLVSNKKEVASARDQKDSDNDTRQALLLLARLNESGYFRTPLHASQLKYASDLEALRVSPDYQKLLATPKKQTSADGLKH